MALRRYNKDTRLTKLEFIEDDEEIKRDALLMVDIDIGDVFKTHDNRIMMRIQSSHHVRDVDASGFYLINLQTGNIWCPSKNNLNEKITMVKATIHIKEIK